MIVDIEQLCMSLEARCSLPLCQGECVTCQASAVICAAVALWKHLDNIGADEEDYELSRLMADFRDSSRGTIN